MATSISHILDAIRTPQEVEVSRKCNFPLALYAFYPHGESYKNVWNTNPTQQMSNEGTKHSETENFSYHKVCRFYSMTMHFELDFELKF